MPRYKDSPININTIESDIDRCVITFFNNYNIDINDLKVIKSIPHNTVNLCFMYIYQTLFKPDHTLVNNQKSLVDYNDSELLQVLANKFIQICLKFNKSLGLMSFALMIGCDYRTIQLWLAAGEDVNPARFHVLKTIQEYHKSIHIGLLNESPVGQLAVANNDRETGFNWSQNNLQQIAANTVYLVPSEQSNRLALDKVPQD